MAKCTGVRCPMQYGYKVDECNHTDCPYRTEAMTNAHRIRAMSDEELTSWLLQFVISCAEETTGEEWEFENGSEAELQEWLKQPAK